MRNIKQSSFVTIIMPVCNEEAYITRSLEAILAQDYPPEFIEVFVADGMSTDRTRQILTEVKAKNGNVHIVDNPGRIAPIGLNTSLRCSKGVFIVRVDGHTVIAPDYVRQCVNELKRTCADNVGGSINTVGNSVFGRAVAVATSSPFGVGGARFHYSRKEEWVDTVPMGAWPRKVFEQIGLFDEELVRDQDDEFNYRLREHGGKILLSPKINSKYWVRSTPQSLFKQYFQYGYWKVRVLQKHPRQMSFRQFIPPVFVSSLLVSILLASITSWGWILFAWVAGSYLLANLSASIIAAAKKGREQFVLLPVCFSILHVSYGLGFLVGLVKFWNRWGDKKGEVPKFEARNALAD